MTRAALIVAAGDLRTALVSVSPLHDNNGAIMGVLGVGWRFGAALGPAAAGFLHDVTGSYAIPFGAAPLAVLVSWTLFTVATSRRLLWYAAVFARRDG